MFRTQRKARHFIKSLNLGSFTQHCVTPQIPSPSPMATSFDPEALDSLQTLQQTLNHEALKPSKALAGKRSQQSATGVVEWHRHDSAALYRTGRRQALAPGLQGCREPEGVSHHDTYGTGFLSLDVRGPFFEFRFRSSSLGFGILHFGVHVLAAAFRLFHVGSLRLRVQNGAGSAHPRPAALPHNYQALNHSRFGFRLQMRQT